MTLRLIPIDVEEFKNEQFRSEPECLPILAIYKDYYKKIGFNKPWIGYFALNEAEKYVGIGGFKGGPKQGKIEIAYGTFKAHEKKGVADEICLQLVIIAQQADPSVRITARTLPEENYSTRILKKNGFLLLGNVEDEDDGTVWEWEYTRGKSNQT